jgi:hypothetical protein
VPDGAEEITAVGAETADAVPTEFQALTPIRRVSPTSADADA